MAQKVIFQVKWTILVKSSIVEDTSSVKSMDGKFLQV